MKLLIILIMATKINTQIGKLELSSPAFQHEQDLPVAYTCDGEDINPAVSIKGIPTKAKSLALVLDDPDAPFRTYVHWLVWNIPPTDFIKEDSVPGTEGKNSAGNNNYKSPCPPSGKAHRYIFKIFALDTMLDLKENADKKDLEHAMNGHILAQGELIGLYKKQ